MLGGRRRLGHQEAPGGLSAGTLISGRSPDNLPSPLRAVEGRGDCAASSAGLLQRSAHTLAPRHAERTARAPAPLLQPSPMLSLRVSPTLLTF